MICSYLFSNYLSIFLLEKYSSPITSIYTCQSLTAECGHKSSWSRLLWVEGLRGDHVWVGHKKWFPNDLDLSFIILFHKNRVQFLFLFLRVEENLIRTNHCVDGWWQISFYVMRDLGSTWSMSIEYSKQPLSLYSSKILDIDICIRVFNSFIYGTSSNSRLLTNKPRYIQSYWFSFNPKPAIFKCDSWSCNIIVLIKLF